MIFGIILDSSVSNTSHHPHFGEEGKLEPSWLHVHLYVFWKKLEEKLGSVANFGDWVSLGNVGCTYKQDPHLQGTSEKAEIYTLPAVSKELWAVLQINAMRISAIVTAVTM